MKPFNEKNPRLNVGFRVGFIGMHGDVTCYGLAKLPKDFESMPQCKDRCVAYGEATGHLHQIQGELGVDFDLRRDPSTQTEYLKVNNVVFLKHQEHCPVELKPGAYRFGRQLEYDPIEKHLREVAD